MPPRKNKGPRARNADSGPAPQPQKQRASQSRAQSQQEPEPKARPKIKPKEASTSAPTSTEKTEKRRPLPKASVSATKAGVRVDKITSNIDRQSHPSNKNRKANMARRCKNNPGASGSKPMPQLELPEGFTRPKKETKNGKQQKDSKETDKTSATSSKAVSLYKVDPKHVPPPGKGACTFNDNRSEWASLRGKDLEEEVRKQIRRFKRSQLRYPSPEWTEEQRRELHDKYWAEEEGALYAARWAAVTKNPGSPKLFIASSMADVGKIHPNHNSGLIRILGVAELRKMIVDHLNPSIGDLTALAATCKRAAVCMRECFDFWDFNEGKFPTDQFTERRDEKGQLVQKGGVRSNILVISPISDQPEAKPYRADFEKVVSLCGAITEIPSTFRSIVLDQIPFLDVALIELMVKSMPNLESVTITRCLRLDVTKLMPLLDVIERHPRRSGTTDTKAHKVNDAISSNKNHQWADTPTRGNVVEYIQLAFFPFFFHGPTSSKRLGSFGVTYNEPTFNTPKAVFSLIMRCWTQAKDVGMDLVSDSSSFWSFVRQLPGPDPLWSMKAREALITCVHELARATSDKQKQDIHDRFFDDLTAALTGDNQKHPEVPYGMKRCMPEELLPVGRYWRKTFECRMCHATYPRSLFPLRPGTCWGCKMEQYVENMEDSHLRLWQESTMRQWFRGLPKDSLECLLSRDREANLGKALETADCMDWIREYFLTFDPKAQIVVPPPRPTFVLPGPKTPAAVQPSKNNGTLPKTKAQEAVQSAKNKGTLPKPKAKLAETKLAQTQLSARQNGQQMSYASAMSTGLPAQLPAPKANVQQADWWPSDPEPWVPLPTESDWPEDTAEVPYGPPPPKTLNPARAAMARWRWNHSPATTPFDYRKGGPQREDPCKEPLSPSHWTDEDAGAEKQEHFDLRWQWTHVSDRLFHTSRGRPEPNDYRSLVVQPVLDNARKNLNVQKRVRDAEWREQNDLDKQVYRAHYHQVEDCLYSMGTPGKRPFNLDKPVPDPVLNAEEYQALVQNHVWESSNYNHSRSGW